MLGFPIRLQLQLPPDSKAPKGVSLLIVIVILGSALLIISAGALLIGLSERESGFVMGLGGEARALADGCMEESYLRIRRDASWGLTGMIPFTASNGSCTIIVSDLGGGNRQIDVTARVAEFTSHIRSTYSLAGLIASWEERPD